MCHRFPTAWLTSRPHAPSHCHDLVTLGVHSHPLKAPLGIDGSSVKLGGSCSCSCRSKADAAWQAMFLDFEWAGLVGQAKYPHDLNHQWIEWPEGAAGDELITVGHDNSFIQQMLNPGPTPRQAIKCDATSQQSFSRAPWHAQARRSRVQGLQQQRRCQQRHLTRSRLPRLPSMPRAGLRPSPFRAGL